MEKKIEILKGMVKSKEIQLEGYKKQIQIEMNYLTDKVEKNSWDWVQHTGESIAKLATSTKQLKKEIEEMNALIDFLTKED